MLVSVRKDNKFRVPKTIWLNYLVVTAPRPRFHRGVGGLFIYSIGKCIKPVAEFYLVKSLIIESANKTIRKNRTPKLTPLCLEYFSVRGSDFSKSPTLTTILPV